MTTSTYKHFRGVRKQANTNIHFNTEKAVSLFIVKRTASLVFFLLAAIALFLHERNHTTSGQSTHVCRVDSHGTHDIQTIKNMYPNISKTINMLNKELPAERELIEDFEKRINKKFEEKINKLIEPQEFQGVENLKIIYKLNTPEDFQELEDFNYILDCLFLYDKIDLEEFKTKFTTGPWIGIDFKYWMFFDIYREVYNASGDNSKSLRGILKLLGEEKIDMGKIRNLIIENYLISLGSMKFSSEKTPEKDRAIVRIFSRGESSKELIKKFRDEEEKTQDISEYIASLLDLLSGSGKVEIFELFIKEAQILKTFIIFFYGYLDSFIDNKDAGSRKTLITVFNNNNKVFSQRRNQALFDRQRSETIKSLKVLTSFSNNEDWKQFAEDLEKNLAVSKFEKQ